MALITNLSTLITEVKTYINDSNLTDDEVKGWIQLAESKFRRVLATLDNEVSVDQVPASSTDTFPTGFNGLVEAFVVGSPNKPLINITPAQMTDYGTLTGNPVFITISAGVFRFNPSAEGSTVTYTYKRKLDDLTTGSPTNYLILDYPDVYLAGTLIIAQKFKRDDIDSAQFQAILDEWIDEIGTQDTRRKYAGQKKRAMPTPIVGNLT